MKKYLCVIACFLMGIGSAFATDGIIQIPSSIQEINEETFYNNTSIYEVVLPIGISSIGSRAFMNSSVKRINLPYTIEFIADDAFFNCSLEYAKAGNEYCVRWCDEHGITVYEDSFEGEEVIIG